MVQKRVISRFTGITNYAYFSAYENKDIFIGMSLKLIF